MHETSYCPRFNLQQECSLRAAICAAGVFTLAVVVAAMLVYGRSM